MISHAYASTCAWMAPHNDSQEISKLLTLITQTWRNSSTTWNGTYVQKVSSTRSTKAAALQFPIPCFMNKEPRSLGPYPTNGNNIVNDSDQQQRPSTYASERKPPLSICSYSKMTGLPPPCSTTCNGDNTSRNPRTPSGGKYSNKITRYTTRSSTSKDTRTPKRDLTLDTWKHPPKKGMNVASRHHFSILSLSLTSHHLTNYLTRAPNLVPHDWGAHDRSHDPVTDYLILTLDCSCDQACDLPCDTM